ncbi:methyltransferase [Devosia aurantiaca]|nr:methyltransferase [Devosia aurantiaca]
MNMSNLPQSEQKWTTSAAGLPSNSDEASAAFALVDEFLRTEIEARALSFALGHGLIDFFFMSARDAEELASFQEMDRRGFKLVLDLLISANVLERDGDLIDLSARFRSVLAYRDLLEAKMWFAALVAPDVHQLFDMLLTDVPAFMRQAGVFELFRYDLCLDVTEANIEATSRWVSYTTILTAHEAPACVERLRDLNPTRMLDVGGNSGEFARRTVSFVAGLQATVFDLPVVCELGQRHVAKFAEADRVHFIPGDLRNDVLPRGFDLISFKSMLHDWPDDYALSFLQKAFVALDPGGSLLIFERAEIGVTGEGMPYSMVANLVFCLFSLRPALH